MLGKNYQHKDSEEKIYKFWEDKEYFKPQTISKEPFTIVMPPPNANGSLHLGHALFVTLEDIMIRYQRMKGKSALLLPGADHAGILTQVVFEKKLSNKKISRYDLGREEFVKQCMEFTLENKEGMFNQMRRLGASCDWSRAKFTLDPDISKEVIETFIKLFDDKLIYRSYRMINWCPRCATALSNLEVEHEEISGKLYFIAYPFANFTHKKLIIATTRPETILGDTAVAVHPDDERYKEYIGQKLLVPFINREIPIIADKKVDMEFGTGAVKITPAHDLDDFEMGKRHNLPQTRVISFRGRMNGNCGKDFKGMKILEAREEILKKLASMGFVLKVKKHKHQVGHCERCKTVIEPQISKQWFVEIGPLAKPAIQAVKNKEIEIIPKRFEKTYFNWMENLHDWCISRQLWWGHQIPVYYCGVEGLSDLQKQMNPELVKKHEKKKGCGQFVVASKKPKKCPNCGGTNLIQDPDTLDTWFSAGQWPYTTLGYPKSKDFRRFYPTSVMETGYDILNIWVSRMIQFGLYRTGKVPFKKIYLHGLVKDGKGQKMSKSKGNVVEPLKISDQYGTDALRMALVVGATAGNDISIEESKIKGYRNFANKIWNITRFLEMNCEDGKVKEYSDKLESLKVVDKNFIKKLNTLVKRVTKYLDEDKFSMAGEKLYEFVWHELADKYVEDVKQRIWDKDEACLAVLNYSLKTSLKMLHPFMPFVTESIWQEIKDEEEKDLIVESWPK